MIGSSIDQSIKLVNWYRSIDDQSKTTQKPFIDCYRLAQQPHCLSSTQDVRVGALLTIRCIIILQQLMLLLLAISLFAKVQLLLPEFFSEGTMRPLSVFSKFIDWPMEQTLICKKSDSCGRGDNVKEKEESIVLLKILKIKCVYNYCVQCCVFFCLFLFHPSAINRYQSITTQIFTIDWSSIIYINRLASVGYPGK